MYEFFHKDILPQPSITLKSFMKKESNLRVSSIVELFIKVQALLFSMLFAFLEVIQYPRKHHPM
jgi:hypothetical protein